MFHQSRGWNFRSSDWITGGPRGTEASFFVFLVLAVLFWLFDRAYPAKRAEIAPSGKPA